MCLGWDSSHLPSGSWAINSQHSWQLGRWVPGPNRLSWCWLHPDSLALSSNSPHLGMAPPGSSLAFFFPVEIKKKKFNLVSVSPAPHDRMCGCDWYSWSPSAWTLSRLHPPLSETSASLAESYRCGLSDEADLYNWRVRAPSSHAMHRPVYTINFPVHHQHWVGEQRNAHHYQIANLLFSSPTE